MALFTFYLKLRFDIQKFSSGEKLLDKWNIGAHAPIDTPGVDIVHAWKDAAEPVAYNFVTVNADNQAEAHGKLLTMIGSLPPGASGELIFEEARAVIPYEEWAEYLASRSG